MRERFIKSVGALSAMSILFSPASEPQSSHTTISKGAPYEVFTGQGVPKNTKIPEGIVFVLGEEYSRKKAGCIPFPSERFRERKKILGLIHRRASRLT